MAGAQPAWSRPGHRRRARGVAAAAARWRLACHAPSPGTVWSYLQVVRPILQTWSGRYGHLREVTRDDVLAAIEPLDGARRPHTLTAPCYVCSVSRSTNSGLRSTRH